VSDQSEQSPATTDNEDINALGYEQARSELVDTVRRLEQGGTTLEESLALWERGEKLAAACQRWLDGAKARLDAGLASREAGARDPEAAD
jgi:exodeoxyribonuclease VII small subunit